MNTHLQGLRNTMRNKTNVINKGQLKQEETNFRKRCKIFNQNIICIYVYTLHFEKQCFIYLVRKLITVLNKTSNKKHTQYYYTR